MAAAAGATESLVNVVVAVARRVQASPKFEARDFEIVLQRPIAPTQGNADQFSLPTTEVRGAETTRAAAERAANDVLGMKPIRSHRICTRSSANRVWMGKHVISVMHFVLVDPAVEPSDLNGFKNSYFNLGEIITEHRLYGFVFDHRELANTALGWFRQMTTTTPPRIEFVMRPKSRRGVNRIIANPLMQNGMKSSLDAPVFSHNNGYFLSGVLKPENFDGADRFNRPRMGVSDVAGVVDLDVVADPYDRAHPSIRRRSAEMNERKDEVDGYRSVPGANESTLDNEPINNGASNNDTGYIRSNGVLKSKEPIYSQSTKKSKRAHAASVSLTKPILEDDNTSPATESTPVTWFSDQYAEITHVPDPIDANDDDVEAALNGLRDTVHPDVFSGPSPDPLLAAENVALDVNSKRNPSPDYPRRGSAEVPDADHPFMDDLNSDFTNPLFGR